MAGVSTRSQPSTSATIVLDPLIRVSAPAGWVQWSAAEEEESVCSALVCRHKFYGQFIYIIADWNCNSTPAPLTDPHPLSCPHTRDPQLFIPRVQQTTLSSSRCFCLHYKLLWTPNSILCGISRRHDQQAKQRESNPQQHKYHIRFKL